MDIKTKEEKLKLIKKYTPKTKLLKTLFLSFFTGGLICATGEGLRIILLHYGISRDNAGLSVSLIFVILASLLTAIGIFDKIAKHAGAGTLVPITGFSNAITAAAMDARSEGFVLGVGAKIFVVAGPVLLYGISAGVIYGLIYYVFGVLL